MTTRPTTRIPEGSVLLRAPDAQDIAAGTAAPGFEVVFPPADSRIALMRQITAAHLRLWGLTALVDTGVLVVSELLTNAVRHGKGHAVGFKVTRYAREVHVEVNDGTPSPARMRTAAEDDETGRGLLIVTSLAYAWGVSQDGTTTWCTLAVPGDDP
jgi:anti-sigma regulatory factor (Ser/Thr protein kinase)